MIEDGVNGFLFEPGNADDLRTKLESVLDLPPSGLRDVGRRARAYAEAHYSSQNHYDMLVSLYNKVKAARS